MTWFALFRKRAYQPAGMALVIEASVAGFKSLFPESSMTRGAANYENALLDWCYDEQEVLKTVDVFCINALNDPASFYGYCAETLETVKEFREFTEESPNAGASNEELLNCLQRAAQLCFEFYSHGVIQTFIGYNQGNAFYRKTNAVLKDKAGEKAADYSLILTKPQRFLKNNAQELAILKLARKAREKRLNSRDEVLRELSAEASAVARDFGWMSFDFCDAAEWDAFHFAGLAAEKINDAALSEKIAFLENYEANVAGEFEEACAALKLSKEERQAFELLRESGCCKWQREFEFQRGWFNLKPVQDELGKRCGLTTLESKYLLYGEWPQALKRPAEFKELAQQRIKRSLLVFDERGLNFFAGSEAEKEFSKLDFGVVAVQHDATELKGTPAQVGNGRGKVKIVNVKADAVKMNQGDVLVSVATGPDLVLAMRKASAIITEEGGITCHAAIVSRELGIPCVVGVKHATKILKDGDFVEVDASKGIVRKTSG